MEGSILNAYLQFAHLTERSLQAIGTSMPFVQCKKCQVTKTNSLADKTKALLLPQKDL